MVEAQIQVAYAQIVLWEQEIWRINVEVNVEKAEDTTECWTDSAHDLLFFVIDVWMVTEVADWERGKMERGECPQRNLQ